MPNRLWAVFGSAIAAVSLALLQTYPQYKELVNTLMTITAFMGFFLALYAFFKD
jgi:hypothetical protein